MSSAVCLYNTACPECSKTGRGSSFSVFLDGGGYCHECGYHQKGSKDMVDNVEVPEKKMKPLIEGIYADIKSRRLRKDACKRMGCKVARFTGYLAGQEVNEERVVIFESYDESGTAVHQKVRSLDNKKLMTQTGDTSHKGLYGQSKFPPDERNFITVTEGEFDAIAIYQETGYAAVSIKKGAGGAYKEIKENLNYLLGFSHVVLCFDDDEAGREAVKKCLELFKPRQVRVCYMPEGDANEMVMKGRGKEIKRILYQAVATKSSDIITFDKITDDDILKLATPGLKLPYPKLNSMLGGSRLHSLHTLVAREKSGKTTATKEIAWNWIQQGKKVGLLYLEEPAKKEIISFVALKNNIPMWKLVEKLEDPDTFEETKEFIKRETVALKDSGLFIYDHKGCIDLEYVYDTILYMVKALDCEYIILDNVSISASGSASKSEKEALDSTISKLVSLKNDTPCHILNVVHVVKNRKDKEGNDVESVSRADVYGTGAFGKFSDALIALERSGDSGQVRFKVLANRFKGVEGYADTLRYDALTGRLSIVEEPEDFDEGEI